MQNVNVAKLRGGRVFLSFPSLEEAVPWIKGLEFEFMKIIASPDRCILEYMPVPQGLYGWVAMLRGPFTWVGLKEF